jgi:hypothetical protein
VAARRAAPNRVRDRRLPSRREAERDHGLSESRYTKEEFARRGDAIYEQAILPKLAGKHVGKFLAIDIETGEFEIAADEMKAGDKLLARIPGAQIWMARIGHASTRSFGSRDQDFELL